MNKRSVILAFASGQKQMAKSWKFSIRKMMQHLQVINGIKRSKQGWIKGAKATKRQITNN